MKKILIPVILSLLPVPGVGMAANEDLKKQLQDSQKMQEKINQQIAEEKKQTEKAVEEAAILRAQVRFLEGINVAASQLEANFKECVSVYLDSEKGINSIKQAASTLADREKEFYQSALPAFSNEMEASLKNPDMSTTLISGKMNSEVYKLSMVDNRVVAAGKEYLAVNRRAASCFRRVMSNTGDISSKCEFRSIESSAACSLIKDIGDHSSQYVSDISKRFLEIQNRNNLRAGLLKSSRVGYEKFLQNRAAQEGLSDFHTVLAETRKYFETEKYAEAVQARLTVERDYLSWLLKTGSYYNAAMRVKLLEMSAQDARKSMPQFSLSARQKVLDAIQNMDAEILVQKSILESTSPEKEHQKMTARLDTLASQAGQAHTMGKADKRFADRIVRQVKNFRNLFQKLEEKEARQGKTAHAERLKLETRVTDYVKLLEQTLKEKFTGN